MKLCSMLLELDVGRLDVGGLGVDYRQDFTEQCHSINTIIVCGQEIRRRGDEPVLATAGG